MTYAPLTIVGGDFVDITWSSSDSTKMESVHGGDWSITRTEAAKFYPRKEHTLSITSPSGERYAVSVDKAPGDRGIDYTVLNGRHLLVRLKEGAIRIFDFTENRFVNLLESDQSVLGTESETIRQSPGGDLVYYAATAVNTRFVIIARCDNGRALAEKRYNKFNFDPSQPVKATESGSGRRAVIEAHENAQVILSEKLSAEETGSDGGGLFGWLSRLFGG